MLMYADLFFETGSDICNCFHKLLNSNNFFFKSYKSVFFKKIWSRFCAKILIFIVALIYSIFSQQNDLLTQ